MVTVIDCSNLGLTEIPDFQEIFSGILELLDFSGNELVTFDTSKLGFNFIGVSRIDLIDLSNNRLTSIVTGFAIPNVSPSYDKLNISGNNFDAFPSKAIPLEFARVDLVIDISNNQLTSLDSHFIADNANLGIPTLTFIARNNLIETVHIMAFANARINELHLDLRDNKLTNISQEFYFPISTNREFNLSGNPWNCDCNFRWILQSDYKEISQRAPPLCDNPAPLRNKELFDLRPDDFVCFPVPTTEAGEDLVITKGDNTVSCPATADPESTLGITWQLDLSCYDNKTPLSIIANSKVATLKDVTFFPESNITCTASNHAGSINIPLTVVNSEDVGHFPEGGNESDAGVSGLFVFLVFLVIFSILLCLLTGAYYFYLKQNLEC